MGKFEQPEIPQEREMTPEESEELLSEMTEYRHGLESILEEKRAMLETLNISPEMQEAIEAEIRELEEQIAGCNDFVEAGHDPQNQFFIKE